MVHCSGLHRSCLPFCPYTRFKQAQQALFGVHLGTVKFVDYHMGYAARTSAVDFGMTLCRAQHKLELQGRRLLDALFSTRTWVDDWPSQNNVLR